MFKDMKLGARILCGFGIITFILAAAVMTSIWQVTKTNKVTKHLIELRAPTAQTSLSMQNGVNRSLAALRGWIILGEDQFKTERANAWSEDLDKSLASMKKYAANWTNPENVERLNIIENKLNDFRIFQQEIEDIAQTTDNTPALKILLEEAAPQAYILTENITRMIDAEIQYDTSSILNASKSATGAIQLAKVVSKQVSTDRSYYTTNVIDKLKKESADFKTGANYHEHDGAIALPATFVRETSESLDKNAGYNYDLVSKWNINNKMGLDDEFKQKAWNSLSQDNKTAYAEFVSVGSGVEYHYATADMANIKGCVSCHNSHPDSPKNDFKVGDLMGILVVTTQVTKDPDVARILLGLEHDNTKGRYDTESVNKLLDDILARRALLGMMADVRGTTGLALASIRAFLISGEEKFKRQYDKLWAKNTRRFDDLTDNAAFLTTEQAEAFAIFSSAREKFNLLPTKMFEIRGGKEWNLANLWLGSKAVPVASAIMEQLNSMVINQKQLMAGDAAIAIDLSAFHVTLEWILLSFGVGISAVVAFFMTRSVLKQVGDEPSHLQAVAEQIADGNLDVTVNSNTGIAASINKMVFQLRTSTEQTARQLWLAEGLSGISDAIRGETDIGKTASRICEFIAKYLKAQIITFYVIEEEKLILAGNYAYDEQKNLRDTINIGDGFVGQVALKKETILVTDVPEDYLRITSSIGDSYPRNILVTPFVADDKVYGVVEIGSFEEFSDDKLELIESLKEPIGIAMRSIYEQTTASKLLIETQKQSRELECQQEDLIASNQHLAKQTRLLKESEQRLQAQQEELRVSNEELEGQAIDLKRSEEHLQAQDEELRATNEELEAKAMLLVKQRDSIDAKKSEAEEASKIIEMKAEELERANSYKSEFLASMSHELRTPLNSLLILAKLLEDNKSKNLTEKQVEFASTIHHSGNELLTLINDILDLSKVEAGKLEVNWERITLAPWITHMEKTFKHVAEKKELKFSVTLSDNVPEIINSDSTRVAQILKNLLSNAFKFTAKGEVSLSVEKPSNGLLLVNDDLTKDSTIAFKITDTGIGLSEDKQKIIFEAFQQADSRTSRKYGGTGLGLSISKELARLLGGELHLKSEEGKGSTFTLLLPICHPEAEATKDEGNEDTVIYSNDVPAKEKVSTEQSKKNKLEVSRIRDDRRELKPGDKSVLIVDDDPVFLGILSELAHEKGFKTLVAGDGHTGLHLADYYRPSAIILDIKMPEINGFDVMERLKENRKTRNIPVHFISGDDRTSDALENGAIGFLMKPVSTKDINKCFEKFESLIDEPIKRVLIVEDNRGHQNSLKAMLEVKNITSEAIGTGEEAVELLKNRKFDCMITDLGLAGKMNGFELADKIKNDDTTSHIPIIVYTGRDLSREEEIMLRQCSDSIIIKGINSTSRLTDEVNLFLHKVEDELPIYHKKALNSMYSKEEALDGKKILIVDDDMRNVFALSSAIQDHGMLVTVGKTGKEGLEQLEANPDVDLVIMDIMMPEMDGYEAMSEIRLKDKFIDLPIIALTAKAMKGEKERCTEAGASDYLSKPVDTERLLSLMRVWLHQK
ncbi:MAG: response regulator [Candidatus Scalindua sp.]|nr:response regulator [Candidatus Scalindua sp.]